MEVAFLGTRRSIVITNIGQPPTLISALHGFQIDNQAIPRHGADERQDRDDG